MFLHYISAECSEITDIQDRHNIQKTNSQTWTKSTANKSYKVINLGANWKHVQYATSYLS